MWLLRLLRHPATVFFVVGHAAIVLQWAICCWSAAHEPMGILWFLLSALPIHYVDYPILCVVPRSMFEAVEHDSAYFWPFVILVLALGSIQWGLIGMLFAAADLRNEPRR